LYSSKIMQVLEKLRLLQLVVLLWISRQVMARHLMRKSRRVSAKR